MSNYLPVNPQILLPIAERSMHPKHRHAAIIFCGRLIVGWANNTEKEHAEIRALTLAKVYGYTKNLILISVAVNKMGKFKLAKPCPKCYRRCMKHGVIKILYSTNEQTIKELKNESN